MVIETLEDKMEFGKFKGMTWGEILIIHPGYLTWAVEKIRNCYMYVTDNFLDEIRVMFPAFKMDQSFYKNVEAQRECYDVCMSEYNNLKRRRFRYSDEDYPTYERYCGSYAQDEMGYSDDDIDTIFDGDPLAYWNID